MFIDTDERILPSTLETRLGLVSGEGTGGGESPRLVEPRRATLHSHHTAHTESTWENSLINIRISHDQMILSETYVSVLMTRGPKQKTSTSLAYTR